MEKYPFIHMRTVSPISTTFNESEDDFSPFASTSSSPVPSAGSSRSNSYDHWMTKRSLIRDEDIERREMLSNLQFDNSEKSRGIGRISIFVLISAYFSLNLALTFYNKFIMIDFPFPYFITALHAGSGTIGCLFLRGIGVQFKTSKRESKDELERGAQIYKSEKAFTSQSINHSTVSSQSNFNSTRILIVLFYSTLYAANIAISNASLRLVSVPFHQIVRSTCPIFTLGLGFLLLAKRPQRASLFALLPIVLGAAFACYGDVNATTIGIILTVLGTFLAAMKTVVTNLLQGGHKETIRDGEQDNQDSHYDLRQQSTVQRWQSAIQKHAFQYTALELLEVMSPLACVQCLLASQLSGELQQVYIRFAERTLKGQFNWYLLLLLAGNGFTAFLLNIVSFKTNKIAGPLTMTVVGNLKQVVTILLAFQLFHLQVQSINIFGIFVALSGTAWYGIMEMNSKRSAKMTG
ncbi:TPT-domain-containing protein [Meira miltonrushii]|uniref:TPT-domain-containing protein n=1 Tax=Meira miltonrushii TaxID=1280837 RepID=A0A316VB84_9BASI|nr:TPT-domain-containing protein [Meira miltonrushii]PWN34358.1 TPT-domain-containing protein [Meira miltonrushii]